MKINRILVNLLLVITLLFLFYVNVGLNISGPQNKYEMNEKQMIQRIQAEVACENVNRHSYQFVTYACHDRDQAYFFDIDGQLIVKKDFSESKLLQSRQIANRQYGIECEPMLGYGQSNPVFVFETEKDILLLDYDTYEEIFYMKGNYDE